METTTKTNIGLTSVGILTVVSLILAIGGTPDIGNWYYGIDNQSNIICGPLQCDKLSAQNDEGISSRCYFINEDNKSTYKTCKEGWVKFENIQKEEIVDFSKQDKIYLYCVKEKDNDLIHTCQMIDSNETIIKLENN